MIKCKMPVCLFLTLFASATARASEADIHLPPLQNVSFLDGALSGNAVLMIGLVICGIGALFGILQYQKIKSLPVHKTMSDVSHTIWETCKTYLLQQGKFLAALWGIIAVCMIYYFWGLEKESPRNVLVILASSVLGILGSYGVAWFGIRINTIANSRTAFSALKGNVIKTLFIP
ncbi:MAG TPA: sodium/proton-translocating pyrophosphatase, partial [Candidatus Baltobacteraceae bacterium]|nr:sodium/proton-translocating pyrophosphatase [Candidatus Baltobacteraceae bacterium]